ncbi:MAG: hypothetical protein C0394_01715 [Syntrophus sp. (in: bacteria)]|nr:hypothetical protein [Syntrophus sp. (in: bacteria)]
MKVFKAFMIVIVLLIVVLPACATGTGDTKKSVGVGVEKKTKESLMEIQTAVRDVLDGLVDAYVNKNARRFMSFVAEDYAGDDTILDRRIRRDFRKFSDMDMRYTFNNVTTDSKNENISVAVTFTRSYTDVKTAKRINKPGSAVLIFRMVDGHPKLREMKRPSLFILGK